MYFCTKSHEVRDTILAFGDGAYAECLKNVYYILECNLKNNHKVAVPL